MGEELGATGFQAEIARVNATPDRPETPPRPLINRQGLLNVGHSVQLLLERRYTNERAAIELGFGDNPKLTEIALYYYREQNGMFSEDRGDARGLVNVGMAEKRAIYNAVMLLDRSKQGPGKKLTLGEIAQAANLTPESLRNLIQYFKLHPDKLLQQEDASDNDTQRDLETEPAIVAVEPPRNS